MTILGQLGGRQLPSDLPYVGQPKPSVEGLLGRVSVQKPAEKQQMQWVESTPEAMMRFLGILSTLPKSPTFGQRSDETPDSRTLVTAASMPHLTEVESISSGAQYDAVFRLLNSGIVVTAPHQDIHSSNIVELTGARTESPSMARLVRNAQELGQFKGEWLLLLGDELVMHSADFLAIRREIARRQIATPFVYYVPMDSESNSVTI